MKNYISLTAVCLILTISFQVAAKKESSEEVNYLELASLMLKDGNLERAEIALSQVDTSDEDLDLQKFYIISALFNIRTNNNQKAIEMIKKAKQMGEVDAVIDVYLAQAAYAVEDFQLALDALGSAGDAVAKIPSIYHMRAQSYWNLHNKTMAIATLDQAVKIFSEDKSFPRRKIFYYLEMGYNKQAAALGKVYLKKFSGQKADYVAIGNALRASGDIKSSLMFLEDAHLKYPNDENIAKSLAAVYLRNEDYYAAAKIIHDASYLNPELIKEAAELYRRAGDVYMALSLNGLISDQKEKTKQRIALFLQLQNFEAVAAMRNDVKRVQLDDDENIQYALAYAFFKIGKYAQTESYLGQIKGTENFKKALELRKIMQDCKLNRWRCQ